MFLNQSGEPQQVSSVNKTVQEIVHLFYHDEGQFADYDYPEYGSKTVKFVGAKNVTQLRIKFHVLRDLQYLNFIKEGQQRRYGNIDASEVIQRIVAIRTQDAVDEQAVELSAMIGDSPQLQVFNIRKFNF